MIKSFAKLLLIAVVLFCCQDLARAQEAPKLTPPAKRNFKYDGKIVSSYDNSKNQTLVLIQLMPVKSVEEPRLGIDPESIGKTPERLGISFYFYYPGQTLVTPRFVSFGVLYEALDPQKYESHLLSAKIDGQQVDFGKMVVQSEKLMHYRSTTAYKAYTHRILDLDISYESFLRLANAKKVKMKLGDYDFDLSKDQLEAIRDLASRTAP